MKSFIIFLSVFVFLMVSAQLITPTSRQALTVEDDHKVWSSFMICEDLGASYRDLLLSQPMAFELIEFEPMYVVASKR